MVDLGSSDNETFELDASLAIFINDFRRNYDIEPFSSVVKEKW